jgi:hypothetical protein
MIIVIPCTISKFGILLQLRRFLQVEKEKTGPGHKPNHWNKGNDLRDSWENTKKL